MVVDKGFLLAPDITHCKPTLPFIIFMATADNPIL